MATISLPSPHEPFVDLKTGKVTEVWYRYLFKNVTEVTTVELTATAPLSISSSNVISVAASTLGFAGQAEQEAGVSSTAVITPSVQQYHPSAAKAWGLVTVSTAGTMALSTGYNIASVSTAGGVGTVGVAFTVPFATSNYVVTAMIQPQTTHLKDFFIYVSSLGTATTGFRLNADASSGATADPAVWHFACYGDQ